MTPYTGNAAGGSLASAISISIPQDAVDTESVAAINTATQKLADYLEAARTTFAPMSIGFLVNPGNTASTTYFAWGGTTTNAGAATTNPTSPATGQGLGQTQIIVGAAGTLRRMTVRTANTTVGGTVTVTLRVNGVATAFVLTINAGTVGSVLTVTGSAAVAIGDVLEIQAVNGVGVTTSIGVSPAAVLLASAG